MTTSAPHHHAYRLLAAAVLLAAGLWGSVQAYEGGASIRIDALFLPVVFVPVVLVALATAVVAYLATETSSVSPAWARVTRVGLSVTSLGLLLLVAVSLLVAAFPADYPWWSTAWLLVAAVVGAAVAVTTLRHVVLVGPRRRGVPASR